MSPPSLQDLRELSWLKGKNDVFLQHVDVLLQLGSRAFPAHTQVLASNSSFLADMLDSKGVWQQQPEDGPLPALDLPLQPLELVVEAEDDRLLDAFEILLRHFYGQELPAVCNLEEARTARLLLQLADYLGKAEVMASYDAELWRWAHESLVPSLSSTSTSVDEMVPGLEYQQLLKRSKGAAWLLGQAVQLRLTLCTAALLPWALRMLNLYAGVHPMLGFIPPWNDDIKQVLSNDKHLATVMQAHWDDSEFYARGHWASPTDLEPAFDMHSRSEWASGGPRRERLTGVKPKGDYQKAAGHFAVWIARSWGRTALPQWLESIAEQY